jgi:hypothetical protein
MWYLIKHRNSYNDSFTWNKICSVKVVTAETLGYVLTVSFVFISCSSVVMMQLVAQQRYQLLTALRCFGDLAQAINCLPNGFLWAGKLEKWHCGALGTITSIINLYQSYQRTVENQRSK